MNRACRDFRSLVQALDQRNAPASESARADLGELAWREHLLGCGACRALLEAEEALEALLESLDEPALPPDLSRRVLARLASARTNPPESAAPDSSLDHLLDLDATAAPAGLAAHVLAALQPHREDEALERLLDSVEAKAPAGLSQRVLAGLEAERAANSGEVIPMRPSGPAPTAAPQPASRFGWTRGLAAAAGLLALLYIAWSSRATRDGAGGGAGSEGGAEVGLVASAEPEPVPDELLASLDLLESWDLLASDDLDLALTELDEVDLLILELEQEG